MLEDITNNAQDFWLDNNDNDDDDEELFQHTQEMLEEYGKISPMVRHQIDQAKRMLQTSGALENPNIPMTHGVDHIETGNTTSGSTWKICLYRLEKKFLMID